MSNNDIVPTEEIIHEVAPSRRSMLRSLALGVGAAGAATLVAGGRSASAADGEDITLGQTKDHTTTTTVNYKGTVTASSLMAWPARLKPWRGACAARWRRWQSRISLLKNPIALSKRA